MGVERFKGLLLLDLDCVTIYGGNPRDGLSKEIYLLHPELPTILKQFDWPVVLLTHRARRDADLIRSFLEEHGCQFADCISAKEMFMAAFLNFDFLKLFSKGLSKSHALSILEDKFAIKREQMILIDDRRENLQELINGGMKCGVLAPFELITEPKNKNSIQSFNFQQIIEWIETGFLDSNSGVFEATAVCKNIVDLPVIGEIATQPNGLFEMMRQTVKRLRTIAQTLLKA